MREKPYFMIMIVGGAAVCAAAGKLYATSDTSAPGGPGGAPVEAAADPAGNAGTRDAAKQWQRPAPAALAKGIRARGFWIGSGKRPARPPEPIYIETVAFAPEEDETSSATSRPDGQRSWIAVEGSVVNLRSGPSISAKRIGSFPRGTRLRVIERRGVWARIEDPETRRSGWMHGDYLADVSGGAPAS